MGVSVSDSRLFVYGLIDPRTGLIRYIGKSTNGERRAKRHAFPSVLASDGNRHKVSWIRQLQAEGLSYGITLLDVLPDGDSTGLAELEQYWIAKGRMAGWPLVNLAKGGEGGSGPKSPETRARIRSSLKQSPLYAAASRARVGTHASPETRARLRASHLGYKVPADSVARMSAAQRARREREWGPTRLRALELFASGMRQYRIAELVGVSRACVHRWVH